MKQLFYICLIFFAFLVLSFSASSARLLAQNQDYKGIKAKNIPHESSFAKALQQDDFINVLNSMGSEECNENDEECLSRRMAAEAHLDYIYTQHHKPKGLP